MNVQRLKDYLSHKTWLWQRIFGHFYLAKYGLKMSQLRGLKGDLDASALIIFCRNEDDLNEFWSVAEDIDQREETLIGAIEDLRYCRPLSWQYDFVATVSDRLKTNLLQSLQLDSVADAYCMALLNGIDTARLIADLDGKYSTIFASAGRKTNLLRRNFSLILETKMPSYRHDNNAGLNFREIVERYISRCGVTDLVKMLKTARTAETKMTHDENECLSLAYYSPYFGDEIDVIAPNVPGCTIAQCVAYQLEKETNFLESLRAVIAQCGSDDDDDDDEKDRLKEMLSLTHHAIFVDPTERCLIDVQRTTKPLYAHVYIEKFPQDDLNNSLPDFIRYEKGWLFTVEFVEDIKQLEVAQKMSKLINRCKQEIIRLERTCLKNPGLALNGMFQQRYAQLNQMLRSFYCICD